MFILQITMYKSLVFFNNENTEYDIIMYFFSLSLYYENFA